MIARFHRIRDEFGRGVLARTILLVVGMLGMSVMGVLLLHSWWPTLIVIIGLAAGFLLRRQIVATFEWTSWALPAALFIYGVLLFVGERMGLSRAAQLIIITLTTVVVFDLQFWSLSDPSIVKAEDD
jgi:hypothetical protein